MKRFALCAMVLCLLAGSAHALTWTVSDPAPHPRYQYHGFTVAGDGRMMFSCQTGTTVGARYLDDISGIWGVTNRSTASDAPRDSVMVRLPGGDAMMLAEDGGNTSWWVYDHTTQTWSGRTEASIGVGSPRINDFSFDAAPGGMVAGAGFRTVSGVSRELWLAYKPAAASNFSFTPIHTYSSNTIVRLGTNSVFAIDDTRVGVIDTLQTTGSINLFTGSYDAVGDNWSWAMEAVPGTSHLSYFPKGALAYYDDRPYVAWIDVGSQVGGRRGTLFLSYKDTNGDWQQITLDDDGGNLLIHSPGNESQLPLYRGTWVGLDIDGSTLALAYSYVDTVDNSVPLGHTRVMLLDLDDLSLPFAYDVVGQTVNAFTQQLVYLDGQDLYVHMRGPFDSSSNNPTYLAYGQIPTPQAEFIPEPATLTMLGLGVAALASKLRRRRA